MGWTVESCLVCTLSKWEAKVLVGSIDPFPSPEICMESWPL